MRVSTLTLLSAVLATAAPAVTQERVQPLPALPLGALELALPQTAALAATAHALAAQAAALPALAATVQGVAAQAAALPALAATLPLLPDLPEPTMLDLEYGPGFADFAAAAPAPWAPQDPADSLYRAARAALNAGDFARAAELFGRIHTEARFRGSEYRAIAYYYDALSRSRVGGRAQLQRARTVLESMRSQHADAWRDQRDAPALLTRIEAELARMGDVAAAREVRERARAATSDPCTDANAGVKVEAISALMQMDAARAMPILEEVLKTRGTDACSAELRRRAIFIVSQHRTERSSAILLDAVRNDPDPEVRKQAVFFLGQVGSDEALSALEAVLANNDNAEVRQQALFAISQHRSPRAAELIRDFAVRNDVSAELRGQALFFLGQRGQASAENARFLRELYPRLTDPEVRQKALFAISQTRGDDTADWLIARALDQNETIEVRKQALFFAGQQRQVPIARVSELYDRLTDRELKGHVAFMLSQRASDPQAVDLLIKIARDDQNPELRKQAIFWLGQSKDSRALAFFEEILAGR